ncbi:hypothetical protein [Pseudosulfitobacter sp. SM2401]|uniref:hypothetical protein n=1 Tax=Pseudosulfitobacter sp. SM2401 TaxID=3350098 RepID=UPI0036F3AFA2
MLATTLAMPAFAQDTPLDLKFAGALEFSDTGTLFVGDNYNGAIYAFDLEGAAALEQVTPVNILSIDEKIADVLGVGPSALAINDMAVHPVSAEIYISLTRIGNFESTPAIMKISQTGKIELLDLASLDFQKQGLNHYPDQETTFRPRGLGQNPPQARDLAKGDITLSSLAIMDMEYHDGELFVSGVAFDNFLSTLRRMSYPFDGAQSAANVEMYHISHDQFETRAPIRAMSIQDIDGKAQLVAAYTCSPLVLIDLDDIVDGAQIAARTIMDYGNGQPLDMVSYSFQGNEMLFLTSNSRGPQAIPINGLSNAKAYAPEDFERGGQMDLFPTMPVGPVGKAVMFDGMSLHIDALGDGMFVSMTRDMFTGSLNLDSNANMFPNRLHNLVAEFDFPQYWAAKAE